MLRHSPARRRLLARPTPWTLIILALLALFVTPVAAQDAAPPSEGSSGAAEGAAPENDGPESETGEGAATENASDNEAADPVLVRVGNLVERLSDIEWRFEVAIRSYAAGQGMPYTEEVAAQMLPLMPTYLEQRGTELVLLREADKRGFEPSQENVELSLERIRGTVQEGQDYEGMLAEAGFRSESMLITLIEEGDLISQVIAAYNEESTPSEEELRVRYLAEIDRYTEPETFCARHILVEDEGVASDLVERVSAGEDFAELAAEFGTDGTATVGGDLGCFGRGAMVADFEDAVVDAEIGEVTGPVETRFGYHALLVYEHHEASVMAFDDVRDEVSSSVAAAAADARLGGLIEGSAIVTYPERVPGL